LSNETDEHGLPYGARDVIVAYCLYRAWLTKDPEKALYFLNMYKENLSDYLIFVGQQRQTMGTSHQEIIFGEEMYDSI